ncbi:mechanosensitive ion channel family protein [Bacteroidota bacterium]
MKNILAIAAFLLVFLCPVKLFGQSLQNITQATNEKNADSVEVIKAIPINGINNASTKAFSLFTSLSEVVLSENERAAIHLLIDSLESSTRLFFADTAGKDLDKLNLGELEAISEEMKELQSLIENEQIILNERISTIQEGVFELQQNKKKWRLTLQENGPDDAPGAIIRRIQSILLKSDSLQLILGEDIDFLLTRSDHITDLQIRLGEYANELEGNQKLSRTRLFHRELPPIWSRLSSGNKSAMKDTWSELARRISEESKYVANTYGGRVIFSIVLFILLLTLSFWLRSSLRGLEISKTRRMLKLFIEEIFQKPFEVSLLLGLYIFWLLVPDLPAVLASLLAIVSIYAIVVIGLDIIPGKYRKYLIGFAVAYLLYRLYSLFPSHYFIIRGIFLLGQVIASYFLVQFMLGRKKVLGDMHNSINYLISALSLVYLVLMVIAVIGNVAGWISLADYLTGGVVKSAFMIAVTYIGFQLYSALIYLLLNSALFKNSNIITMQSEYLFGKLFSLGRFFFILSWVVIALDLFKIKENILEAAASVLTHSFAIGKASIALINIIIFVLVIWLSLWISKIVRHILNEEVFSRVKVEKGMPGTIIMLVRIALISIGFILAARAAGIEFSSLAIILGAFSVGIGFGLQNIFNNLVSGLILAFERPIKEGDIVELNTLLGRVKKIGIRSSIVRTYAGAEVIVPNGELISNQLINWTLSDQFRRVDIRIGVAYGTDPDKVLVILNDVASTNQRVIIDPPPKAYFIDFGESSLDFRLLAWVDQDFRLEIESELRVSVNLKLKEAGIEIPFPQRDLHVKTMSEEVGKKLKGM